MEIFKIDDMVGGWYIGAFKKSAYNTQFFEVCYKQHKAGDIWPKHYHMICTEINYLINGKMKIQDKILESGDIFILYPGEIADPKFLSDCDVVVVKTPSCPGDKYEV